MKNSKQHAMTAIAMLVGGLFSQGALSVVNNPTSDVSNDDVLVNNATWNGNFSVSNPSQNNTVHLSNTAQWNGDLAIIGTSGGASVNLDGSAWNGAMSISGTYGNLSVVLDNGSVGVGRISGTGTAPGALLFLSGGSEFTGDLAIGDNTSTQIYTSVSLMTNALLRGNVTSVGGGITNASASVNGASQWYGDMDVRSFTSPLSTYPEAYASALVSVNQSSLWQGSASVDNGGGVGSAQFLASIYGDSVWTGDTDIRSGGTAHFSANLGERSRWDGSATIHADEGVWVLVSVMGNSTWNGNVGVSSEGNNYLTFNLFGNSTWNGGLDLTQASLSEYGVMMVDIRDGSRWQGFLNGPALATVTVDQSEWVVTGNTAIKELNITNSSLGFGDADNHPAGFHTLTIAGNMNVTGSVPLSMRTNMEAYQGDLLVVQGDVNTENNAPLRVSVNNQGGANITDFSRELTIVQTEGRGAVELTNDVEVGAFLYRLKHDGNDWRLYAAGVPMQPLGPAEVPYTPVAEAALETMNAGYLLTYGEMQTLTQRLGDLRTGRESDGAWARAFGGRFDIAGRRHLPSGFDMKYSGVQIGADRKLDVPNGGGLLLGAMFGTAQSKHDYARGDGKIDSTHAGVYGTYEHPEGGYADVVIKYNHIRHDDSPIDTRGERQSASAASNGFSGSLEIGKRYLLSGQDGAAQNREGWYVEPQFQVTASRQSGTDLDYSNGLRARFDAVNSLIGRAGVQAGYELKSGDNPISLYAKVSYVREFDGDVNVRFNNIDRLERFRGNWISSGLGVNAVLDKRHSVYADLESNNGNLFNSLQLNAGYRMSF